MGQSRSDGSTANLGTTNKRGTRKPPVLKNNSPMITQQSFSYFFNILANCLSPEQPFSEETRNAYYREISPHLDDYEWEEAVSRSTSEISFPTTARLLELGRDARYQKTIASRADDPGHQQYPPTDFQRMNPAQQAEYLAAVDRARAIVASYAWGVPKRVKGFGTIGEAIENLGTTNHD